MFNSIKAKIVLPIVVLTVVLVVFIVLFVSLTTTGLTNEMTSDRMEGISGALESWLDTFDDRIQVVSQSVSRDPVVIESLAAWNEGDREQARQTLIHHMNAAIQDMGVTSFVLHDSEGTVILRAHAPDLYGDDDSHLPFVAAARAGNPTFTYASTGTMPMGITATEPVFFQGENVGSVATLYFLHTDEFVDMVADVFNARITIFGGEGGNTRIATTIVDESGARIVGTTLDDTTITDAVLGRGEGITEELEILGSPYVAYYFPIIGAGDNPIGMFFAGFSNESAVSQLRFIIVAIIIVGIIALAGATLLILRIANQISSPIKNIVLFLKQASSTGDLSLTDYQVKDIEERSKLKSEIGDLYKNQAAFVMRIITLSQEVNRMADGDFSKDIEELSEKDTMGTALNRMTNSLNLMFSEINSASRQVAAGSKQIADGSQSLASGSTEQAASVQQLSSSISEIAEKTKDNASMAERAAMLANDIKTSAEKGSSQMDEMMVAVKDINASSQNISKVIKSIDDIAFQTNILALNAAVEAARAGQHGKGFAVVAEEVRNLAAKSAESAKDTERLIADSIEKAELGSRIADETASSLSEIVAGIGESSQLVADIAKSSEGQSVGIEQINRGIDQVAHVTQQNSATAEQSAAASQEMNSQSDMLEELIGRFKLKDDKGFSQISLPSMQAAPQANVAPPSDVGYGKY